MPAKECASSGSSDSTTRTNTHTVSAGFCQAMAGRGDEGCGLQRSGDTLTQAQSECTVSELLLSHREHVCCVPGATAGPESESLHAARHITSHTTFNIGNVPSLASPSRHPWPSCVLLSPHLLFMSLSTKGLSARFCACSSATMCQLCCVVATVCWQHPGTVDSARFPSTQDSFTASFEMHTSETCFA